MNKTNQVYPVLMVLTLALAVATAGCFNAGPPEAEKQNDEEARLLSRVPLKYDKLHRFLDEAERPALEAVHRKYHKILENWFAEHGETVRNARAALIDFVKTKDRATAKAALQDAKQNNARELIIEEQAIQKEYETAVLAAVPAEKLKRWQADKISRTLLEFLQPLELTEEQKRKVHQLAPAALQQVQAKDQPVWHARGTVNLEMLVGKQVLTQIQQQPFEELKAKHRLRKMKWAL